MRRYEVTECAFPIDPSWVDLSVHRYELGAISLFIGRGGAEVDVEEQAKDLLASARLRLPRYRLLFHRESDRPVAKTIHFGHEYEDGSGARVELHAFFTLGATRFAVQCAGPSAQLDACEAVMTTFIETFRVKEAES